MSLEEVLANRERRVLLQGLLLGAFRRPVLSMTLVIPGPTKDLPWAQSLLEEGLLAVGEVLGARGWAVLGREMRGGPTGPEALLSIEADALDLKRALVDLEDTHPLGRLWDLDVLDPAGGSLSRRSLGSPARKCLLCGEDAHACARSQSHPLPELLEAIHGRLREYGFAV